MQNFVASVVRWFLVIAATGADSLPEMVEVAAEREGKANSVRVIEMLPGIVEPSQQARLSASIGGVLAELRALEGQSVDAGDIVAVLDNRVARAELKVAEAESRREAAISQAESELRRTDQILKRLESLQNSRAVSEMEIDQAVSARDRAQAALAEAHERANAAFRNLDLARARLDLHNVTAPFAGTILRVDARHGETVTGTDTLVHIADLTTLRVELHVPIELYSRMQPGQVFHLQAAAPIDRKIAARLMAREPVVNAATQTFRCLFQIDNRSEQLVSGFAVKLVEPATD